MPESDRDQQPTTPMEHVLPSRITDSSRRLRRYPTLALAFTTGRYLDSCITKISHMSEVLCLRWSDTISTGCFMVSNRHNIHLTGEANEDFITYEKGNGRVSLRAKDHRDPVAH